MAQFHESGYERRFFEGQLPNLIKNLDNLHHDNLRMMEIKEAELELKHKELALKEKELLIKERELQNSF
ncbi:hypothetical protein HRF87_05660 [Bacillus sp. CRN 9]|nr:hypothetical protein [Bacillus sp. CRN 9]